MGEKYIHTAAVHTDSYTYEHIHIRIEGYRWEETYIEIQAHINITCFSLSLSRVFAAERDIWDEIAYENIMRETLVWARLCYLLCCIQAYIWVFHEAVPFHIFLFAAIGDAFFFSQFSWELHEWAVWNAWESQPLRYAKNTLSLFSHEKTEFSMLWWEPFFSETYTAALEQRQVQEVEFSFSSSLEHMLYMIWCCCCCWKCFLIQWQKSTHIHWSFFARHHDAFLPSFSSCFHIYICYICYAEESFLWESRHWENELFLEFLFFVFLFFCTWSAFCLLLLHFHIFLFLLSFFPLLSSPHLRLKVSSFPRENRERHIKERSLSFNDNTEMSHYFMYIQEFSEERHVILTSLSMCLSASLSHDETISFHEVCEFEYDKRQLTQKY